MVAALLLVLTAVPASAHDMTAGATRWCFGKSSIVASIELHRGLLEKIKGIADGRSGIASAPERELQRIAARVIQPYITRNLTVTVDGKPLPVKVTRLVRNDSGSYTIWLSVDNVRFTKSDNEVSVDYRLLFDETDDTHICFAYTYLAEAGSIDAARKIFASTQPDSRTLLQAGNHVIDVSIAGAPVASPAMKGSGSAASPGSAWSKIRQFVPLGIGHILTGYDHLAFLLALIVIGLSAKEVMKVITAFTVAHSITLLLAALQIVSLNSRLVESTIALSICYVALENLLRKKAEYRWLVTFGFGLMHGFGFAGALRELIVGRSDLLVSVLSFNFGVEAGQILVFLLTLPMLGILRKRFGDRVVAAGISTAVFALGFTWLIERVFDLKLWS